MYERIILADDGSALSRSAVPLAAAVAVASGGDVLVVRVSRAEGVNADHLREDQWDALFTDAARERAASQPIEAEPHLAPVVEDLLAQGVRRAGSLVLEGDAGDALVEAADELDVDLVALSSRGEGGLRRAVLGSVAEHLVQHAHGTAVLLCQPSEVAPEAKVRRVLLTLDGSDLAATALPHAEFLARQTGAELVLLQATDAEADIMAASMPVGAPPRPTLSAEQAQRIASDQQVTATEELGALSKTLEGNGIARTSVEVLAGNPVDAILGAVERLDVDVVVMATRGRGGVGRLVLGSVADAVARRIEGAAVLLVRASEDD